MSIQRAAKPVAVDGHYDVQGRRYVRVTSVLAVLDKPGLADWRGRVGNDEADRISREARDFGTRLHAELERISLGEPVTREDESLAAHTRAYEAWLEAHVSRIIAAERFCVSHDHQYAGTADALVEMRTGELAVLDFKTNKAGQWDGRKPEHALQLAAYRLALAEEGIIVARRLVLNFPSNKPGQLLIFEYTAHKADTLAFLDCLSIYRWQQTWKVGTLEIPSGTRKPAIERANGQSAPRPPVGGGREG